jgi:hypothetical protein
VVQRPSLLQPARAGLVTQVMEVQVYRTVRLR